MSQYKLVRFNLNGKDVEKMVDVRASLTDMLRNDYHMTSVKKGCEVGECGACNVIIDGEAFNSCIYLAVWADGKHIRTLESLMGEDGELVVEIDVVEGNEDDSGGKRRESIHHALFVHHEPILAAARDPRDLLLRAGRGTSAVLAIEERAQPLRLLDVVDVREEVQVLQDELPLRGTQMDYASLEGHARVQVQ